MVDRLSNSGFNFFLQPKNQPIGNSPTAKMSNQDIWLSTVYRLYQSIDKEIKTLHGFEENTACSFLASVLTAIRKNNYSTLQANPEEVGAIPKNIFVVIDEYIKKNQAIILGDKSKGALITPEFLKAVELKLNANSLESFKHIMPVANTEDANSAIPSLSSYS